MLKRLFILLSLQLLLGFIYSDEFIVDERAVPLKSDKESKYGNYEKEVSVREFPETHKTINIGYLPTPDTLLTGNLIFETILYTGGGVGERIIVGIMNFLDIGLSIDCERLIGNEPVGFNIPGGLVKLNLIRDKKGFNLAFGFDSLTSGSKGRYTNLVITSNLTSNTTNITTNRTTFIGYGFYITAGWSYYLLENQRSLFICGVNIPFLPLNIADINNISLYCGTILSVSDFFTVSVSIQNFYITLNRIYDLSSSFILSFLPDPQLKLSLILEYEWLNMRINRDVIVSFQTKI